MLAPEDFESSTRTNWLGEDRLPEDRVLLPDGREDPADEREPTLDDPERLGDEDRGETVRPEGLRTDGDEPRPNRSRCRRAASDASRGLGPIVDVVGGTITGRELTDSSTGRSRRHELPPSDRARTGRRRDGLPPSQGPRTGRYSTAGSPPGVHVRPVEVGLCQTRGRRRGRRANRRPAESLGATVCTPDAVGFDSSERPPRLPRSVRWPIIRAASGLRVLSLAIKGEMSVVERASALRKTRSISVPALASVGRPGRQRTAVDNPDLVSGRHHTSTGLGVPCQIRAREVVLVDHRPTAGIDRRQPGSSVEVESGFRAPARAGRTRCPLSPRRCGSMA